MVGATPIGPSAAREEPLHGVHVMVVDDEPAPRNLFRDALGLAGARVTVAASAREALAAITREAPDLLVSDIMMPGEDGYWLIEAVRALVETEGRRRPRAVAVTGNAQGHSRDRALRAGYDAHLVKPVSIDVLVATVGRLVGRLSTAQQCSG